jgi:hypothetical protein
MPRPAALLLLLLACQPTPRPAPEDSPRTAAPAVAPAAPASDRAWWCTCYTRSGPTAVTSCRNDHADCRRIEKLAIEGGGSAIVPGSLTHRCREIRADHPGDVLGARDGWQAGEKSVSWLHNGACLLPGPSDGPPPTDPKDSHDGERFGELDVGMTDAAVRAALGEPTTRGNPSLHPTTGLYVATWLYPARGLSLDFVGDTATGPWTLEALIARPPCDLRTSRGIGLGDVRRSVDAAYLKDNPFPMRPNATSYIAVTAAHSLHFEFDPTTMALVELQFARRKPSTRQSPK